MIFGNHSGDRERWEHLTFELIGYESSFQALLREIYDKFGLFNKCCRWFEGLK